MKSNYKKKEIFYGFLFAVALFNLFIIPDILNPSDVGCF